MLWVGAQEILAVVQQSGQEKSLMELEERVDEEFDRYQDKMAELMHDVNVDCFTVSAKRPSPLVFGAFGKKRREEEDSLSQGHSALALVGGRRLAGWVVPDFDGGRP